VVGERLGGCHTEREAPAVAAGHGRNVDLALWVDADGAQQALEAGVHARGGADPQPA
jgi:hypothetical protein